MNKRIGQVAGQKALITVFDLTSASNALISSEISLLKNSSDLTQFYCNPSDEIKKKSIIYRSIKKYLKKNLYKNNNDFVENIISEALLLLKQCSIKFFESKKEINFEQFAVVYISENIKSFLSKSNGQSSSDKNELIHSAIRILKRDSNNTRLSFSDAKHLAKHFNLCSDTGYKKIWELETLHFEKKSLWKHIENENGSLEEICIADKIDISLYDNTNQNEKNNPETLTEEKEVNKKVTDLQKKILLNFEKELTNNKEKLIFNKRIFNSEYKISKLKDLSSLLNISVQRINKIEKKLKSKVKDIFDIEKKKLADIG